MMDFDYGYQQPTVFDRLWVAARQRLGQVVRGKGLTAWGAGFLGLALAFHIIGSAFLLQAITSTPVTQGAWLAQLGSALLAFGVGRHFTLCALPLLPLSPRLLRHSHRALANFLVLGAVAMVLVPLVLYVAISTQPLAGLLLLTPGFGLVVRQPKRQSRSPTAVPVAEPERVLVTVPTAVTVMPPAQRRAYLAELRAAGVSVSIARALVTAGLSTEADVKRASDEEILAVRGVGPATLQKIRVCFRSDPA